MKITKKQLESLINEAVAKALIVKEEGQAPGVAPGTMLQFDIVQAVKNMLRRASHDNEEMLEIANVFEEIKMLLQIGPPKRAHYEEVTFRNREPYAKILYAKAKKQFFDGKFDPKTAPSGNELLKQAQHAAGVDADSKRALQKQGHEREAARRASMTSDELGREDSERELNAVYGGDRTNKRSGLGT